MMGERPHRGPSRNHNPVSVTVLLWNTLTPPYDTLKSLVTADAQTFLYGALYLWCYFFIATIEAATDFSGSKNDAFRDEKPEIHEKCII